MPTAPPDRGTLRFRALRWLREHETRLVALLAAFVVLLTFLGYALNPGIRAAISLPQAVYDSLKSIAGGVDWGQYGWQGDLANWFDLVLIMWVAVKAVLFAFANSADAVRARSRRNHTVVCGLGGRGRFLGEALLTAGEKVTVIESDRANPDVGLIRAQGACVLIGDPTRHETLEAARVTRAARVVCALPDDERSAVVAREVRVLVPTAPPVCFVHNASPSTWSAIFGTSGGSVVPFSALDSSCNDIFLALDLESAPADADLIVLGTGSAAESVIIRAAKVWQAIQQRTGRDHTMRISVVGVGAGDLVSATLPLRYPGIDALCDIAAEDVTSYDVAEHVAACTTSVSRAPFAAVVATEDDAANVRLTLALSRCLPGLARLVAVMTAPSGLLDLVGSRDIALAARLTVIDVNAALADPQTVLGGPSEELARLAHEDWLHAQLATAATLGASPPLHHWPDLPEAFKASNRDQMACVFGTMLPLLGAHVVPVAEWDATPFAFREREVERLARLEHDRWCAERTAAGWTLDSTLAERDAERKLTPWLVGYDELPEVQKDNDRDVVTRIPVLLARAGFRIKRSDIGGV